jgi:hypothetical protein
MLSIILRNWQKKLEFLIRIFPNVAKVGGLQSQGVKGEVVAVLPRSLYNAGSEVLRLSRRVNNMDSSAHPSSSLFEVSRKWDISNISDIITGH